MKVCPYCGRSNDDNVKICTHCYAGFPYEESKEQKQPVEEEKPSEQVRKRTRR